MIDIVCNNGYYEKYFITALYNYTNLDNNTIDFDYSKLVFGKDAPAIQNHFNFTNKDQIQNESVICIVPSNGTELDYLLFENDEKINNDIHKYLTETFGDDISKLIETLKEYNIDKLTDAPVWVTRELISFFILSQLNFDDSEVDNSFVTHTNNIVNDFLTTLNNCIEYLGLEKTVDNDTIINNHGSFLSSNPYMGRQAKIDKWIEDVLNSIPSISPCKTIYEEAYVQAKLKQQGWNIQCAELDDFPKVASQLSNITIKYKYTNEFINSLTN